MTEFRPERIFAALAEAGADYVTVGGFAVAAHGVVRATLDVDIVPGPGLEALCAALLQLEARPDGEPDTQVTAALLGRDANMRFETAAGQIDVLGAPQYRELFAEFRARALVIEVEGVEIVVASRNDLIRLKAATGRDRDLLDIGDLLALEE
jgi:hypothetical protein